MFFLIPATYFQFPFRFFAFCSCMVYGSIVFWSLIKFEILIEILNMWFFFEFSARFDLRRRDVLYFFRNAFETWRRRNQLRNERYFIFMARKLCNPTRMLCISEPVEKRRLHGLVMVNTDFFLFSLSFYLSTIWLTSCHITSLGSNVHTWYVQGDAGSFRLFGIF